MSNIFRVYLLVSFKHEATFRFGIHQSHFSWARHGCNQEKSSPVNVISLTRLRGLQFKERFDDVSSRKSEHLFKIRERVNLS